ANALVFVAAGHARARPRGSVFRRAGAALPGGPHRPARWGTQLRINLSAPGGELARDCRRRHLHRPTPRLRLRRCATDLSLDLQNCAEGLGPACRTLRAPWLVADPAVRR